MSGQADDPANLSLIILRRLEGKLDGMPAKQDEFAADPAQLNKKLDKLVIEVIGVKGRVRKPEESFETIARVMSADA